ncbi:DNA replication/repair protein RecF [Brachybacterium sp. SGAir0954]|uniref:DNA replication/repair protein RecF n=1 Tax=Brachybacterium sp. SGAir0954 TaxID=2571029 RepID=UPI0010CCD130|nr:DNA replication/repair protein RecF [Brachybacterium sp. SGAir0954]QCR52616.1 DNA replication/repair protein RecF [Brachybacterium sp. SGAir0954]
MQLTSLELTDFRSYPHLDLPVRPGITVLVGRNGQGKTNVVEALWYLATLSSHRVPHDAALVHRGSSTAIVRASFVRAGRPLQVDLEITPGRANRARLQGQNVSRLRDLLGEVRAVLFAPEDLGLVKGDPEGRRRFLDELLFVIAPRYASVKADYDRVLKQRSNLLKQMRSMRRGGSGRSVGGLDPAESAASTLEVWDQQLARHGAELLRARLHLVNRLRPHLGYSYLRVATDEGADSALDLPPAQRGEVSSPADVAYRSAVLDELGAAPGELPPTAQIHDALLALIAARHDEEIDRGVTLTGPHRDDLEIRLHDFPAKGYASHGESWSLALALRLASYDLLRLEEGDLGDGEPILVLDDVFSELDVHRRERLGRIVTGASQVLITTANDSDIPASLEGSIQLVDVTLGHAVPRGDGTARGTAP